jgi:small subunit ribosomal protein S16
MLVIRMQRTGRKGHAQFRVVVQDSRRTPTSGRVVAPLGSYNPHTKETTLDKEKAAFYLEHGAQPSDRVVRLLQAEGVKLPSWVKTAEQKSGKIRNPEKLRRNQPEQEAPAEEAAPVEEPAEAPVEEAAETPAVEEAADTPAADAPAEEATTEEVAEEPAA